MKLQRANHQIPASWMPWDLDAPLRHGEWCRLLFGGPPLLVVDVGPAPDPDPRFDLGPNDLTVAYQSPCGTSEHRVTRSAVRRL